MVVIYCTLDSVVLLFNIRALNCLGQGGEMLKPRLLSPSSPPPSPYFISPSYSSSSSFFFLILVFLLIIQLLITTLMPDWVIF